MTLGELALAVEDAEQSVTYADRSGDELFERTVNRTTLRRRVASGRPRVEAERLFREAEQMQEERQPQVRAALLVERLSSTATCFSPRPSALLGRQLQKFRGSRQNAEAEVRSQ